MTYKGEVTYWGGMDNAREPSYRPDTVAACYPPYHSPEWWDMMWKKHEAWRKREAWREDNYPVAAGTGYEVTPPTGVEISSS